jgi:hypothetical protein
LILNLITITTKNVWNQRKKELASIKGQLYDMMVYLALSGKWKEWEAKQPIGVEFTFDLNMLLGSGDKNIDEIFKLYEKILETTENLKV